MTVEQLAWTLTALLAATIFGNMYYLGSRMDRLASELASLRAGFGELRGEMHVLRHSFETHLRDHHEL